jgi:PhzF family phenazine biosynthesis protein
MKLTIYQVDAFAEKVFAGNPAAVVPLEHWLEEELMQKIANENNLSETAFFVKTDGVFHIRWFTPDYDIDLCGHATLASAYVIKNFIEPHLADINFTTQKAGELKAFAKDGLYRLDFPSRMPQPGKVPPQLLR